MKNIYYHTTKYYFQCMLNVKHLALECISRSIYPWAFIYDHSRGFPVLNLKRISTAQKRYGTSHELVVRHTAIYTMYIIYILFICISVLYTWRYLCILKQQIHDSSSSFYRLVFFFYVLSNLIVACLAGGFASLLVYITHWMEIGSSDYE